MKKLAAHVTAITLLAAGTAAAADMRRPAPYKAPPAVAPVATYNWTGCYVGAGGGYGMWNQDATVFEDLPSGRGIETARTTFGGRGWFGTVQVGCDYQIGSNIVIGAFGDYDFASIKGDFSVDGVVFGREKLKSSWAAGGRIGWLPFQQQQFLVFVSGGYTQARFGEVDLTADFGPPLDFSIGEQKYSGWFIGTGYEYQLGWFPGLTWKTEYRFADYGKKNVAILEFGLPSEFSIDMHKYVHTVRSELVWRFNFGGYGAPVAARY